MNLEPKKGTYALIFQANQAFSCKVGRRGNFVGDSGSYIYVGSAFGPGGIYTRISHHLKLSSNPHWHLDYIRPYLKPVAVCYSYCSKRHEHQWAITIGNMDGAKIPMHKFGASDCSCRSHLFYFPKISKTSILQQALQNTLQRSHKLHVTNFDAKNIAGILNK
jgi:Uri superfamily endonuclease